MAQTEESQKVQQLLSLSNLSRRFVPGCALIVSPISNLLKGNRKDFKFGDALEEGVLKIVMLFTS